MRSISTNWSDSASLTRASPAPCTTINGVRIRSTRLIGERASVSASCSGAGRVADIGEPVVGEHRFDGAGLAAHEGGQVGDADDVDGGGEDVRSGSGAGR